MVDRVNNLPVAVERVYDHARADAVRQGDGEDSAANYYAHGHSSRARVAVALEYSGRLD